MNKTIAANELRIGNIFIREIHGSRGIEYDHEFVLNEGWMGRLFSGDISIALQDLHPIELTPEILEKAGFEYYKKGCEYSLGDFRIIHWNKDGYLLWNYEPMEIGENPKMKVFNSVHELQNLFYSLKGEELPIEL